MARFRVAIYQPVFDITRCVVDIDADTQEDAVKAALSLDHSELDFQWVAWDDSRGDAVWADVLDGADENV